MPTPELFDRRIVAGWLTIGNELADRTCKTVLTKSACYRCTATFSNRSVGPIDQSET